MKRRFQRCIVRTEILSTFHTLLNNAPFKPVWGKTHRNLPNPPLSPWGTLTTSNAPVHGLTPLTTQTTAQSVPAHLHNYATKSPLAIMGRPKFTLNCHFPFADHHPHLIHLSLDRPHSSSQTASGSNQPFCHSILSGHTDTDRRIG